MRGLFRKTVEKSRALVGLILINLSLDYCQTVFYVCGNSSVVEHNLAKVGVASSNLVSRSKSSMRMYSLAK